MCHCWQTSVTWIFLLTDVVLLVLIMRENLKYTIILCARHASSYLLFTVSDISLRYTRFMFSHQINMRKCVMIRTFFNNNNNSDDREIYLFLRQTASNAIQSEMNHTSALPLKYFIKHQQSVAMHKVAERCPCPWLHLIELLLSKTSQNIHCCLTVGIKNKHNAKVQLANQPTTTW